MKALMVERDSTQHTVERARDGDRDAFDQLAEGCQDRLRVSIQSWSKFQLGPKVDAEDVIQETLLRAYRSLGNFEWRDDDSFFRWLCGIAKRTVAQAVQDARRTKTPASARGAPTSGPSPTKALRRHERFERLEAALEKLSPAYRQAILLCRIEGLTSTEVAERMNRSPAAVRQLLVRALRELKKNFGDTQSLHLPDRQLRQMRDDDGE